ncbi:cytochrome P450 CYP72A219-like [Coffea arabica]|uniref:Cytochrome P450 CYP72A219-like n=1 Tax=Coffea arabica TaxID=13443 RepID=A0ABM4UG20_COFAR
MKLMLEVNSISLVSISLVIRLTWAWKMLNNMWFDWFQPKKLERQLNNMAKWYGDKEIDLETRAILRDVMSSSEKRMRVGEKGEDFLGIMMESKTKAIQEKGNKENAGLTDDQVTMILNEVLRLYPPALWIIRSIYEETKLGEVNFNPERVANAAKKPPNSFLPFGLGPRIRIGQNFAMMEAKVAIALILQNFSFELA